MSEETPIAAPESTTQAHDAETDTSTPPSVDDALAALHRAVGDHASDSMSRALGHLAEAMIAERDEENGPPQGVPEQWAGALAFLQDLQGLLDRLDHDQARNVAGVMQHLFSRRPSTGPNGAYR